MKGSALIFNTQIAVSLGGTIPLLLKGFNIEPILASGPILTTLTDMIDFFLMSTFASMMLGYSDIIDVTLPDQHLALLYLFQYFNKLPNNPHSRSIFFIDTNVAIGIIKRIGP